MDKKPLGRLVEVLDYDGDRLGPGNPCTIFCTIDSVVTD